MHKEQYAEEQKLFQYFEEIYSEYSCFFKSGSELIKFFDADEVGKKALFKSENPDLSDRALLFHAMGETIFPSILTINIEEVLKAKSIFNFLELYREKRIAYAADQSIETNPFVPQTLLANVFSDDELEKVDQKLRYIISEGALRRAIVGLLDLTISISLHSTQKKELKFIESSTYVSNSEEIKLGQAAVNHPVIGKNKEYRSSGHSGKDQQQVRAINLIKNNNTFYTALLADVSYALLREPYLIFVDKVFNLIRLKVDPFSLGEILVKSKEEYSPKIANACAKRFILLAKATDSTILSTESHREVLGQFLFNKKMTSKKYDDSHIRKLLSELL